MLIVVETNQFEKDMKIAKKRGKSIDKIKTIVRTLEKEQPLAAKHRDHKLSGKWSGFRECHIEPDWLLIYRIDEGRLYLIGTGNHSDFGF